MFCQAHSLSHLAAELGVAPIYIRDEDSPFRLDMSSSGIGDTITNLQAMGERIDARHGRANDGARRDSKSRHDSAAAFLTSGLSAVLLPVVKESSYRFLFTPGMTNTTIVPVVQRVALGQQQAEYEILAYTGEARRMAPGATKSLKRVGVAEDQKTHPVMWAGVRFGWNQFDLWKAMHLPGRNVQAEQQRGAMIAMAEFYEDHASYGDLNAKIPGFFNGGSANTCKLPKSFGDPTINGEEIVTNCKIMQLKWSRSNPNRIPSGVAMPESHMLNMIGKFIGTNKEGANAWQLVRDSFPWLSSAVMDDRLLTASPSGGPMWQMWAADGESQYLEATPTPMLFGPFETEMSEDFVAIMQVGGFVNKDPNTVQRFYM